MYDGYDRQQVLTRSDFGHYPAVTRVYFHLRGYLAG